MREFDRANVTPDLAAQLFSRKNSPEAWGERMRRFLEYLIDHPLAHVPHHSKRWRAMIPYCERLSPLQLYSMRNLLGKEANQGYHPMPDEVKLEFPRGHQVKLDAQTGWHFLVGSCWDENGTEYGIEFMLFGEAIFPPKLAAEFGLSDLENQAVEVQFAVSERGRRHRQAEPLVALGTSGLISVSSDPFAFELGTNSFYAQTRGELFPLRVVAHGLDRGEDPPVDLAIDLLLTSGKEYLPQGDRGAMPSIDGMGTYYYSIPAIQLDPSNSTLTISGRTVKLARGQFWFDHQWGYLSTVPRSHVMRAAVYSKAPDLAGWDWFMVHFEGDRQVTMFAPHSNEFAEFYFRTEEQKPGPMTRRVGGTFMDSDKSTRMAWGTMVVDDWVKTEHSPRPDRYPPTHTWHPNHYRFTFDDLPPDIAVFSMEPIVEGGQSAFFAHGVQICEGAVVVRSPSGKDLGRGFAEAVNYADTLSNTLRLAGLPQSKDILELVADRAPWVGTRARNIVYVLSHRAELESVLANARGMEFFSEFRSGK
jgi:predicted secreted hydrolase